MRGTGEGWGRARGVGEELVGRVGQCRGQLKEEGRAKGAWSRAKGGASHRRSG